MLFSVRISLSQSPPDAEQSRIHDIYLRRTCFLPALIDDLLNPVSEEQMTISSITTIIIGEEEVVSSEGLDIHGLVVQINARAAKANFSLRIRR